MTALHGPSLTAPRVAAAAAGALVRVPFNQACLAGAELDYVRQAILSGHLAGDGPFTARCHALLEAILGAHKVLLTTSCTAALEMAALLLDVRPGDEVIVPSFTFVSTASAFALRGATIRFADIRPDTLNLDEARLEGLVTPRTRAIVPVHYAGVGCSMDRICAIAAARGIAVVEDNAHGLLGRYQGRHLGTFGAMSTNSFHETKNFTCGEGGALVINDPALAGRAEILREKGTNRSRFIRGEVDKYTWVDVGSSFLPSDILAAFLLAQLEARDAIQARRRQVWTRYETALGAWAERHDVALPATPDGCTSAYHLFYLLLPTARARQRLMDHLRLHGISAVFHYQPLHLSPMGQRTGTGGDSCPITEDVCGRLLRLPLHAALTDDEQARVVCAVESFRC
jgi:dTDP-4-amino-4,6-dideoxygalactose transaminase